MTAPVPDENATTTPTTELTSALLRMAATKMWEDADTRWDSVAGWLQDEFVHAGEAEYLATHAQNVAMTNVAPAYRPSAHHAFAVARAYLGITS